MVPFPGAPTTIVFPETDEVPECARVLASGFGLPNRGVLEEVEVDFFVMARDVILTGDGICFGDSGGPLWVETLGGNRWQIGVTSFTLGDADDNCRNTTNGFINVITHRDWVLENVR